MKLPPKNPGFPHSAILHAIVNLIVPLSSPPLMFYGSVLRRLAGFQKT
jgi:hypothetical protein